MAKLLQFDTDDDVSVIVEVDDTEPGLRNVSRDGAIVEAATKFEDALQNVASAAAKTLQVFRDGRLNPDEVKIEFGVRFNAEAGAVIAKTSAEGHLTVHLKWSGGTPKP